MLAGPFADRAVEVFDRPDGPSKPCDLPDHEHPLSALLLGRDLDELVSLATHTLRGEAQSAEVELLELGPGLAGLNARRFEAFALTSEGAHILVVGAARRVARSGLQEDGLLAADRLLLITSEERARRDDLFCEEVGGAHQDADTRASLSEGGGEGRDHRRAARVVDPASEEDGELFRVIDVLQDRELLLPEREGRSRPDVTAALTALEDEAARALLEEHLEEPRGGDVEVCPGPLLF